MDLLRKPAGTATIISVVKKGSHRLQLLRCRHHSSFISSNATIGGIITDNISNIFGIGSTLQPTRGFGVVNAANQKGYSTFEKSGVRYHLRYGCGSFNRRSVPMQQRLSLQNQQSQRWISSSKVLCGEKKSEDTDDYLLSVDYTSPLGELISRLKMVSITGCFLSVCVLPALVFLKNGDLPSARQVTLGTFATIGATGSTVALHFVFGAYVLEMKPVTNSNDDTNGDDQQNPLLLEATTRSIFGFWNDIHVFDPKNDVTPYVGMRPFANFCANEIPLYVHPERLDSTTRQLLLHNAVGSSSSEKCDDSMSSHGDSIDIKDYRDINEGASSKRKKEDDELF